MQLAIGQVILGFRWTYPNKNKKQDLKDRRKKCLSKFNGSNVNNSRTLSGVESPSDFFVCTIQARALAIEEKKTSGLGHKNLDFFMFLFFLSVSSFWLRERDSDKPDKPVLDVLRGLVVCICSSTAQPRFSQF